MTSTRRFAEGTVVSVEKSRAEIERMIVKYGATSTAFMNAPGRSMILFESHGRRIVFNLPILPANHSRFTSHKATSQKQWEQYCREQWRSLALVIKAKMEAVQSGITTFEDEFLAHIMMPDGLTVGDHVKPKIAHAYKTQTMVPLLPAPDKGG